jgi:predicted acylesterase/phospholipase RssA
MTKHTASVRSDAEIARAPGTIGATTVESEDDWYDLIVSSGGGAAVLCGVGTLWACKVAGVKWRRIGGVSGGAIATGYASCGVDGPDLVTMALESNFGENLSAEQGLMRLVKKLRRKKHVSPAEAELRASRAAQGKFLEEQRAGCGCRSEACKSRPKTGLYGTEPLGRFFAEREDQEGEAYWPANFWTMATTRDGGQVVMNAEGVTLFQTNGEQVRLSDTPMNLASAVRASCTIPGFLAALEYKGMLLFDGALSRDGICPVGVQIRHFGADPKRIIACRVNEDALTPISGRIHRMARKLWRVHPDFSWNEETAGVIEFRPLIDHVHTFKFTLSRDAKWLAIMVAFECCMATLALRGILRGEKLALVQSLFDSFGFWRDAHPSPIGSPQLLSERFERSLVEHGLF